METVNRLAALALEDPVRAATEAAATPVGYDILLSLGVLLASDIVISFGLGARGKKARWFFIHAICNAVIVAVAFLPALAFIKDPVAGISTNVIPFDRSATVIAVLHAYHLLFFKCSAADWFHHIAFVGTLHTYTHTALTHSHTKHKGLTPQQPWERPSSSFTAASMGV